MLDLDGPMGQCFSRFLTGLQRSRGRGEEEKGRHGIDKIVNQNSQISHLQVQLAYAWHAKQITCYSQAEI